ncbi:MAG: DUF3877 family protein [Pseudobutyrivibrio sp.]|nr:DUF3877 family protein [Pseudobutyrivibrio sp.]
MNYEKLEKNIINIVKENQLKLGYRREKMQLFYPMSSINRVLDTNLAVDQMQAALFDYFSSDLTCLKDTGISHKGERFMFLISEETCEYVHDNIPQQDFMKDFIHAVAEHGCTVDKLRDIFYSYSDRVYFEKADNREFDYLAYFLDGDIDDAMYCITDEGHHVIYHRYTREDYADFGF